MAYPNKSTRFSRVQINMVMKYEALISVYDFNPKSELIFEYFNERFKSEDKGIIYDYDDSPTFYILNQVHYPIRFNFEREEDYTEFCLRWL